MRFSLLFSLLTFTLSQTVDLTKPATSINVNPFFASYAVEWQGILDLFVTFGNDVVNMTEIPDSVLNIKGIELIKTLIDGAKSSGTEIPFILRVGGNSANKMWWVPSKLGPWSPVDGLNMLVGPGSLIILQKVCKLTGIKLLLNIGQRIAADPLKSYNPELITAIYQYIDKEYIYGIEMGNEADHYTKKGFRPLDFSFADYLVEADVYNSWIKKALLEGSPPILTQSEFPILSGPSFAYPWLVPHLAEYAAHIAGTIQDLAIHRYEDTACFKLAARITPAQLALNPSDETLRLADMTIKAASTNQRVFYTEYGSASCGGLDGVSDSFASAIFTLDSLFELAQKKIFSVAISGNPHSHYAPIYVSTERFYPMTITPAFYGMLLFNIATFGPTSTFYSVPSSDPAVKIWVSLNPNAGNSYSVLVINKHESSTIAKVSITTPSTSTVAKSITLSNPYGLSGLNKTVLGQVDFNDPTSVYKDIILSIIDSSISISVEPASAMLVRISDVDQGALFSDNSRPVVLPGLGPSATKKVKTCVSRKCSSAYSRPETFLFVSLVIGSCFWF